MKNPKVSIIIPVYNGSNYLKDAIDSALNQTYDNIEIIVINDGSTDNGKTRHIALSYKDKIKYMEKENGGVSTALNLGIKNMSGKYFSWLSHDDLYEPDKISKQIEEMERHSDKTILYSNYKLVDYKNQFIDNIILDHDEYSKKPLQSIINMDMNGITLLIPKTAFEECGVFDENLRCVQDYDLWVRMMSVYKFVHMNDVLASSRVHPNQVSNKNPKVITEGNEFYKKIISVITEKKMVEYEGSRYLFLDNLEKKLRYNSNYGDAANYVYMKKNELLKSSKESRPILYWIIDAKDKNEKEVIELIKRINSRRVKIGIIGKKVKGYDSLSYNDEIDKDRYKYVYFGDEVLDFAEILRILEVSDASIIGNYLLDDKNIAFLDKYSKFLHLCFENVIIKNSGIKIESLTEKFDLYINALNKGNLVLYKKVDKGYTICEDDMETYLKSVLKEKLNHGQIASLCYQISVIHNKIRLATGSKKVVFYEPCEKCNDLKYSRLWNIYNKIINMIKRKK